MKDFALTGAEVTRRNQARELAHDTLPAIRELTRDATTPEDRFALTRPGYQQLVEAGALRWLVPERAGGDGGGLLEVALVAEELMAVDANVPLTLFATSLGIAPIVQHGTAEQQRRLLAPFLTSHGTPLAAFALSEPGGSANVDAAQPAEGVRTTATPTDHGWRVNGVKKWISNAAGWEGTGADLITVVCRNRHQDEPVAEDGAGHSVLAMPGPVSGLTHDASLDTIGHRAHLLPTITLRDVHVPHRNVIGKVGSGLDVLGDSFLPSVALVGAFALALMRSSYEFALSFARTERRGGNVPILEHQAIGYRVVDVKTRIEAVRALTWRACHALDVGAAEAQELALHAKVFGSETAVSVITDLMYVVGVDSYDHTLPLGGLLQDALALPLFGGSNLGVRRRQLHRIIGSLAR